MANYFTFWRRYADFQGKTTRRSFWLALLIWCCVEGVLLLACGLTGLFALGLSPDQAYQLAQWICGIYELASCVPLVSVTVRRLRDAGYGPKSFLWLLVPVFGEFAFLARLCAKTKS